MSSSSSRVGVPGGDPWRARRYLTSPERLAAGGGLERHRGEEDELGVGLERSMSSSHASSLAAGSTPTSTWNGDLRGELPAASVLPAGERGANLLQLADQSLFRSGATSSGIG